MNEIKNWADFEVGDFLHIVKDYGDQLYEVVVMGEEDDNFHLRAMCFFGRDKGKDITLYKL